MKLCPDCQQLKQVEMFSRNRRNKDGRQTYCKVCMARRVKAYKRTPEGREKTKAAKRAYQQTDKAKKHRREYLNHPDVKAERRKQKRRTDKRYRHSAKGKATQTAAKARRRTKKRAMLSTLTGKDWQKILEAHNHRCHYCGKKKKLELDHVIPISTGGTHTAENVVPACRICNAEKGNRLWRLC